MEATEPTEPMGTIGGRRGSVKKSVKRSVSPKPVKRTKRASSPKRVVKARKPRTGGYEEQANMENEMLEAVGGGTCGIGGAKKSVQKARRPRSASPAKNRRPRKARKGGSEEEEEENQQQGGGRKMKHKRMCARKLSPYNLFVKKRMCEMRKQTKSPVVALMKQIAAEWKAKK